jgi:hypothetical protein
MSILQRTASVGIPMSPKGGMVWLAWGIEVEGKDVEVERLRTFLLF